MKICLVFLAFSLFALNLKAINRDSVLNYHLPDSVKAISFITDIKFGDIITKKEITAGIRDVYVSLLFGTEKGKKEIEFKFPKNSVLKAWGGGTDTAAKGEIVWKYNWSAYETYKLMLATASDSAENFILYSGYVFLPAENKWKLIGTCKISGQRGTLKNPASFFTVLKKEQPQISFSNTWCQRNNASWKNLNENDASTPVINLFSHADSINQSINEVRLIEQAVSSGNTDARQKKDGIYYTLIKEGTGREVKLSDTVTVHYKGYLHSDGTIFDQTKEKPATFSLKRLIRGWQIGLPLCRVGGKIKLVIPSALAYSIRTRAAKIPPNSILVFEIEVVDTKEELLK